MLIPVILSIALQTLLPSGQAVAADQVIKVADGSWAICQNTSDAFHHMLGTYRIHVTGPQVKADWLVFNVKVEFLACQQNADGNWGFTEVPTYAPLRFKQEQENTLVHTKDVFLTLSQGSKFITSLAWDPGSRIVAVGLNDVLSEEQVERYKAGDEIAAQIDFQLEKNLVVVNASGEKQDERYNYGTHQVNFTLKK